jgi:D-inositol-3-phosphate glycosyltransferase
MPPALRVVRGGSPSMVMFDPGNFTPFYIDGLCRALKAQGVYVRVVTSPPLFEAVDPAAHYGIDCHFFPALKGRVKRLVRRRPRLRQSIKVLGYPVGLWRTWRHLRRSSPGVFHVHWALMPLLDGLLLRGLKRHGWRIVLTVHDPLPPRGRHVAHRLHQWLLRPVDSLIVHTPRLARDLISEYPQSNGRVHVIPHGEATLPPTSDAERAHARWTLGLPTDRPLLLFFGMIKPYKGLEYLLAAMPGVLALAPQAVLVVAGEPLMPLHPFEDQIDRLGIRDSVVLRPSFIAQGDVPLYFVAADLLVAPYLDIAASGVIAQAQSHGRPAVVTRVGGLPEFVEPDECGFVVPPRSSEALAEAIGKALADPDRLRDMGDRARRRIAREHDWSTVARLTLEVYHSEPVAPRLGSAQ